MKHLLTSLLLIYMQIYLHEELTIWASRARADGWEIASVASGESRDDLQLLATSQAKFDKKGHQRAQSQFLPELKF